MRFIYASNFATKDSTSDFRFDIEKASKMKYSVLKPPKEEDLQNKDCISLFDAVGYQHSDIYCKWITWKA
ncbi:hypothetical protein NC651_003125 [Populus alba x Populus x berolinensis]|nr:hypothetical protein NC651_003125 [Populus alba x Populus x berolinensis]